MRISRLLLAVVVVACNGNEEASSQTPRPDCRPLETRAANAPNQKPAFPAQTRACAMTSDIAYNVQVVARGLVHPWAIEPLPGGDLLVTERPGRLRIVSASGTLGEPITGLPRVDARGQGGLLDVALSPDFATDRTIFWSYAEPREGGNGTAVARGVLSQDRRSVEQVRVIFRAMPTYDGTAHFGSRLAFGSDGTLFITTGDRSDAPMRMSAQRLDNHMGKVLRINADGSVPRDNPFVSQAGALPEIWSYGHRNTQSMAFDPEGQLWIVEHGTRGGDELNLIKKGVNYGWPLQAYGIEYNGQPIPGSQPAPPNMQQPQYYWDPVIAPSGMQFYTGSAFPEWRGNVFIGGMVDRSLVRLRLEDNRVTGIERIARDRNQRVRDVRQGPDGALYVVTDEENGEAWKITPRR